MKVLISGASIAGPVLAYWLSRHGSDVTVVERSPALRKTGGHAVDLFRPAMEISERMGVLPDIEAHATGTTRMFIHRPGSSRPARLDYVKLIGAMSDRHVEIMRDDLSEIYYRAGRDDVEYLFGDTITSISADGDVTFEHSPPRRFDVVVGATACTPECAVWRSATTWPRASSAAICQWCRCRKTWPATAR